MGGTKKQKRCGYNRPHYGHVWVHPRTSKKYWCGGAAMNQQQPNEHTHIWDHGLPIRAEHEPRWETLPDAVRCEMCGYRATEQEQVDAHALWNGPFECPCGRSAWLHNGVKKRDIKTEVRFPQADAMERAIALKTKLDKYGEEGFTDEDKTELSAIADALVDAFKPLVESFQKMAEQVMEYLASFFDRLDPETVRELHRLAQSYGEHTDSPVETIELRDVVTGDVIAEQVLGYDPIAALQHAATEIVEDAVQPLLAPDPSDPVEVAKKALEEPFKEPFHLSMTDGEMISGVSPEPLNLDNVSLFPSRYTN